MVFAEMKLPVSQDDKTVQSLLIKYDANRNGMIEVLSHVTCVCVCMYVCITR